MANDSYNKLVTSLEGELLSQATVAEFFERYYLGDHRLRYVTKQWQDVFGAQLRELTSNWCQIVVDAAVERLSVEGFTFPSLAGRGSEGSDETAWQIWQDNSLDSWQDPAHRTVVYAGRAYTLVAPPGDGQDTSRITVEHPAQMYVRMDPGRPGRRLAAIKRWQDLNDDGTPGDWQITLYLPNGTYRLRRQAANQRLGLIEPRLLPRYGDDDRDFIPNPLGVVPVVPLENRPMLPAVGMTTVGRRVLMGGLSDLHTVTPLQDAITKTLGDLMIQGEFTSFPQRWLTGVDVPTDPETGEELDREKWLAARDRVWTVPSENAKFGEFPSDPGTGLLAKVDMLVQHIAAQSRTPPHYLLGKIVNASGDALKAAEVGLVARVRAKQGPVGDGWEETVRIACGLQGDLERFNDRGCEAAWADPEVRSEGEAVDAALKLWQGHLLPLDMVLERLKYSPQQRERAIRLLGMPDRPEPPGQVPTVPAGPPSTNTLERDE